MLLNPANNVQQGFFFAWRKIFTDSILERVLMLYRLV